jgi:hypothetical protein
MMRDGLVPDAAAHRTDRILSALGLVFSGLTLFLVAASLFLTARNGYEVLEQGFLVSVAIAALVGGLITSRRPRHPIGWLIAGFAICFALGEFSRQYVIYGAFRQPGVLPFISLMAIPVYFVWYPGLIFVMVFLPLLYPNGHLLSPRWRPFAWLCVVVLIAATILAILRPRADEIPGYPNPLGVGLLIAPPEQIIILFNILQVSWIVLGLISLTSLLLRFRLAGRQERAQIEWLLYSLAAMLVSAILSQGAFPTALPEAVSAAIFAVLLALVWISIAVAILRYHLLDIDLIIRRTLVYALVTALMVVVFFVSVVVLQRVFASLTGVTQNELVTVLSTLAIAALFVPIRDRIQSAIDKRFNRNRYDAQQVLNAFAQAVRDETDLERLAARLMQVVDETMQPTNVSVWLKREDH